MREIRKYNSCDGKEFATQRDAAHHECTVAIPKILKERITRMYAAEHGAPTKVELRVIDEICSTLLANRRNARSIRDTLSQFGNSAIYLPLEVEYA